MNKYIITILAILLLGNVNDGKSQDLSSLKGPYLGQKRPGKTPEIFAPGIVQSNATEFGITISVDGNEIYFTRRLSREVGNKIYSYKNINGKWTLLSPPLFGWGDGKEMEPNLSPDENRLYFVSRRPLPEGTTGKTWVKTWYVEKSGHNWSEPKFVGSPVMESGAMYTTQSNSGNIFFTGPIPGQTGGQGIHMSKIIGDKFDEPKYLPDEINGLNNAGHPYIAPDESYILYDYNNMDQNNNKNLVINLKEGNSWGDPINLSEYIGNSDAYAAFVSFDGKYLFFSSGGNIYWVDAGIIEEIKNKIGEH